MGNWAEDDAAYRNIGRNLLGDEDATAVGRSTQRRDYTPTEARRRHPSTDADARPRAQTPGGDGAQVPPRSPRPSPNGRYDATVPTRPRRPRGG